MLFLSPTNVKLAKSAKRIIQIYLLNPELLPPALLTPDIVVCCQNLSHVSHSILCKDLDFSFLFSCTIIQRVLSFLKWQLKFDESISNVIQNNDTCYIIKQFKFVLINISNLPYFVGIGKSRIELGHF